MTPARTGQPSRGLGSGEPPLVNAVVYRRHHQENCDDVGLLRKVTKRRTVLLLGALLAIALAALGGLALKSALAGTPTSGDKSDIKGATFTSGGDRQLPELPCS